MTLENILNYDLHVQSCIIMYYNHLQWFLQPSSKTLIKGCEKIGNCKTNIVEPHNNHSFR